MKPFDEYKNKLPYPSKAAFQTTYWYNGGKCVASQPQGGDIVVHNASAYQAGSVLQTMTDDAAYSAARQEYNRETARLEEVFKQDLFKDLGIQDHPAREKLFSKAWEDGHSSGYSEVYNCALHLVDLIEIPAGYKLVPIK